MARSFNRMMSGKLICLSRPALTLVAVFGVVVASPAANLSAKIDFNRDIRPLLADNCYACHGPDAGKRKAGLRLDLKDGALAPLKSGEIAIVPGDLAKSELIARITAKDEDDLMPPVKTGKQLTAKQVDLLKRWIAQGAQWKAHWSFIKPERPPAPAVKDKHWPRNPLDTFILARLDKEGLRPAKAADQATLIRRVTFDLTGLPPTPAEVDEFLADLKPEAYERLVDRLLQSPRYGEHEARYWLDAARYGDTHGLHLDNERSLWPYRDWVVGAFNRNQPFDEFTTEQLAGDLLPAPTREQKIASGFNRCNVSTSEGGAIDDEFYVRYAVDRAETTATAWMGLTVGCAVCHDHKFDPISQKEFYQFYAFFNNFNEKAMDGNALLPAPTMKLPTAEQEAKLTQLDESLAVAEKRIRDETIKINYTEPERRPSVSTNPPADFVWVEDDFPKGAQAEASGEAGALKWIENGKVHSGKRAITRTDKGLAQDFFTQAAQPLIVGKDDKLFAYVYLDPANPPKAIMLQYHTSEWLHRANWGDEDAIPFGDKGTSQKLLLGALPKTGEWVRLEIDVGKLELKPGTKIDGMAFTQFGGTVYWDQAGIVTATAQEDFSAVSQLAWEEQAKEKKDLPKALANALKAAADKRTEAEKEGLREYYLANIYAPTRATFAPLVSAREDIQMQRAELDKAIPATMISREMETPRGAFILKRGQYDQRGDPVQPGVPGVLPPLATGATTNRLDFARWLVSPEHPLTARVTVNRFWQQFFGTGIVKTSGDFGAQGEWPSHPELLDWLACEFMQPSVSQPSTLNHQPPVGWDVQHLLRLIVTSATYRQNSSVTPKLWQADPANRLLARGPRFRLDAEMIRDNALFVSGLLVEKMGGRGVRPYQPSGIWEAVGYTSSNTAKFEQDHGEALYRRSLYTFWKRTAPPPYLSTFDAPSREKYCTRRERTDTPLQALVTMNDPAYVEAARQLSARMLEHTAKPEDRLNFGFRLVTARQPLASERTAMQGALKKFLTKYQGDPEAAKKLIAVGESPVNEKLNASEFAAYTMVASLLLNLDETLNKN